MYDENSETSFELTSPDSVTVKLNVADMKLLDARYILSTRTLDELTTDQVQFTELTSADGYYIYQVEYS